MRVVDLFCGAAGGWSLGLHRAGYRTVAAAEADPWRRAAFLHNNPGVEMWDDVRDVTARSLRERLGYLPEVVVGSPPCQDASSANHRGKGIDGERTGLFFEALRIVREVRPVWCCFENVPGLRTRGVDRVLAELEAAGYACWPLVVGAVHAGANHRRNRVWIVAYADERRDRSGRSWSQGLGRVELGEGESGGDAPDAESIGRGQGRPGRSDPGGARQPEQALPHAGHAPDAHEAGLEVVGGERGEPRAQRQAAERDGTSPWDRWNGGWAARAGRVDDAIPRGLARDCLAAYGDAVVPAIPEAIGRVMARLVA